MHFVFATRGINHQVELWKNFMQAQMFTYQRENLKVCQCGIEKEKHPTKECKDFKPKIEHNIVQGALRPIQLWEYVFPKEHKDMVLTSLNVEPTGKVHPFAATFNSMALRKAMGLKKVKYTPTKEFRYMFRDGVALYPIGIKEDVIGEWKDIGYRQEML